MTGLKRSVAETQTADETRIVSSSLAKIVQRIRGECFVFPPAAQEDLSVARVRGVPDALLNFYAVCDGAFIGEGDDFPDPNGQRYRLMIPRLRELQTVQSYGYILPDSPLYEQSSKWWQIVDYGDANWLAYDGTHGSGGRIIDIFHETVGEPDSHNIVANSLDEMLNRLVSRRGVYWFDEEFESPGAI